MPYVQFCIMDILTSGENTVGSKSNMHNTVELGLFYKLQHYLEYLQNTEWDVKSTIMCNVSWNYNETQSCKILIDWEEYLPLTDRFIITQ
jgi:hypothetical protein